METNSSSFARLPADEQKRLLDKVAKLKALSECATGNVNETATAAAAMARILLEYQIEMADLEMGQTPAELEVREQPLTEGEESLRGFPNWQTSLLSCLAEVNHCVSYTSTKTEYYLWTQRNRNTRHLIGTHQDIENTRRLFHFCVDEIERLCKAWGVGQPVKRKNDFRAGASRGVRDKVRQERDLVIQEARERAKKLPSRALELFDRKEQASQDYADSIGLYNRSTRTRYVTPDAYNAGYQAGAQLDLSGTAPRRALPAAR